MIINRFQTAANNLNLAGSIWRQVKMYKLKNEINGLKSNELEQEANII